MKFAIIGLGKMGSNIAMQAIEKGYKVAGFDLKKQDFLEKKGVKILSDVSEIRNLLKSPRIVFIFVPAGKAVDVVLDELTHVLDKGDIVIDAGNSYFKDSQARNKNLLKKGLHFIDCGTSGGLEGARYGACFMVGGDPKAVNLAKPILDDLAVKGGFFYAGKSGAGHFVKIIHNAIEFGMLQSIGEGFSLLTKQKEFDLNLQELFENWSHGSVIRSWLIELMAKGLKNYDGLKDIDSYVEDTGEVNWVVEDALKMEVPIPIISLSIMELFKSRQLENDSAKAIAVMRNEFGGHPFGKDNSIEKERKTGKSKMG